MKPFSRIFLAGTFALFFGSALCFAEKPSEVFLTSSTNENPFFAVAKKKESEKLEIRYLIEAVRKSQLLFIRNGKIYPGQKAASHLLWKYRMAEGRVKTTKDFIEEVASQSMLTGSRYMVKDSEGAAHPLKDVLYNELKRLQASR